MGLEAYCVSFLRPTQGEDLNCAVMESVRHNDKAPAGTCWIPRTSANCADALENRLIRQSLDEFDGNAKDQKPGRFAKPGWLRELFLWVREQLAPLGLRPTGRFPAAERKHGIQLDSLETDGGAVWFKATGEPNAHELSVTLALARLFPHFVPRILGVHPGWNGWLTAEVAGISLDEITDLVAWEQTAETLAELQITSLGYAPELFEAQFKDLRILMLKKRIDPFLGRMNELMAVQEKRTPPPLVDSELQTIAEGLKEACSFVESLGLPDTLGHIDFNPGNILVSEDRCVFLDWAEGCVTNPLVTFEYLCEHMGRSGIKAPAARKRLTSAYLRQWTPLHLAELLRRALALSPLIAVFAYAVAGDAWRSPDLVHNVTLAGFFRSLTRRMYREAMHADVGSELCLD